MCVFACRRWHTRCSLLAGVQACALPIYIRMLLVRLVHQRLGEARLVALVMAEAAIAPHIDDDIAVEFLAELDRHLAGEGHRLGIVAVDVEDRRSEEHTSELQSLMRISYAVFCLKKQKK